MKNSGLNGSSIAGLCIRRAPGRAAAAAMVMACAGITLFAQAPSWPQFRGPQSNPVSEAAIAFTSSPWAYGGRILCLNEEGKAFVVDAGEKYQLVRVNDLDEMALATPALAGDRMLLRTEGRLYASRQR